MEPDEDKVRFFAPRDELEAKALEQIYNVANLPFIRQVAVMADCHLGKGSAIGTVFSSRGAVIPAAVGVDIGCGMIAVQTSFRASQLPDNLTGLCDGIYRRIPAGAGQSNNKLSASAESRIAKLKASEQDYYAGMVKGKWEHQLGSLGGGNHFIEICSDEGGMVWVVLHSGSRGIGHNLAMRHIRVAQKLAEDMLIPLADKSLAYLPEAHPGFKEYLWDVLWAQNFALANREEMMDRVMTELSFTFFGEDGHQQEIEQDRINCHHNFVQMENHAGENVWVTRKGAIQMRRGQRGVIPGSMGTSSFIVSGLENAAALHSAPHGAGRRMSRTEAKRRHTLADLESQMAGVASRKLPEFIDEIPSAYKDIEAVIAYSKDLVRVEHKLKPLVSVKGAK